AVTRRACVAATPAVVPGGLQVHLTAVVRRTGPRPVAVTPAVLAGVSTLPRGTGLRAAVGRGASRSAGAAVSRGRVGVRLTAVVGARRGARTVTPTRFTR